MSDNPTTMEAVTTRPILFSAPMVRALLCPVDPKTQTRRTSKLEAVNACPDVWDDVRCFGDEWSFRGSNALTEELIHCPYGKPGDRLWVRETTSESEPCFLGGKAQPTVWYRADNNRPMWADRKWTPSILSPRRLSRITLEITGVRVERLQGISEADAKAEGAQFHAATKASVAGRSIPSDEWFFDINNHGERIHAGRTAKDAYELLWESINGPGSWDANPWVWVVEFKRATP
jgi:hypothetical protein